MIRRLGHDEFELLRELRLDALADDPSAFGSSYEREAEYSLADWRHLLRPDGNPTFVAENAAGTAGMVVVARDERGTADVNLVAMWVRPAARGSGVGDALVRTVLRWASESSASLVRLCITEGNDRAERLYTRHGFVRTGRSKIRDRDGRREIEMETRVASQ